MLPPAPTRGPLGHSPNDDEPTIAEVKPPDSMTSVPPTLRPSAATVRPAPRQRGAEMVAGLFWSAVAVGFGASSAAVWWELNVEPEAHAARNGASEVVTRLPDKVSWMKGASVQRPTAPPLAGEGPPVSNASASDAGTSDAGAIPGAEGQPAAPACARRFFAAETFSSDEDLRPLCDETDLRNVREQIHRAVVRHAAGAETEALVSWGTLGWYQLPLLSVARHACCGGASRTTVLPRQHGLCDGLGASIDALATTALACSGTATCDGTDAPEAGAAQTGASAPEQVASKGREFAGRVQCLHREGRENAFGYRFRPSQQNRSEFERLLRDATAPTD